VERVKLRASPPIDAIMKPISRPLHAPATVKTLPLDQVLPTTCAILDSNVPS